MTRFRLTALTFTHFLINLQEAARGESVAELSMVEFAVSVGNDCIADDRVGGATPGVEAVSAPVTLDFIRAEVDSWAISEQA